MKIKFFCYEKDSKRLNLYLPDIPDNDYEQDCDIVYKGKTQMAGIKWNAMGCIVLAEPIELTLEPFCYEYNETNEEIEEVENCEEGLWD